MKISFLIRLLFFKIIRFVRTERLKQKEKLIAVAVLGIIAGNLFQSFVETPTLYYIFIPVTVIMAVEKLYIVRLMEREFN